MAKAKKARLAALPLGGVGEIGMNMMVYECDDDMIVVDAGISFPDDKLPGTNVVLPDTKYIRENIKKLRGVFITHAHEDHIGGMPYLWEDFGDAPVYVSPFASKVLENKLSQVGYKPGKRMKVTEEGKKYKAGSFEVEYVHVPHSVPEMFSLALHTPHGVVVHTGDYKFDDNPVLGPKANEKRFKELGDAGVLAMLGDSTSVFNKGDAGSEGDLAESLEKILKKQKNRVFFSTFASNTGRLIKMIDIASKHDRKTVLMGRTAQNMVKYAKELGYFPGSLTNYLISSDQAAGMPRDKVMVVASGTQGEPQSSLTRLSQGHNIRGVKIEAGDTVIMSSNMIPGNERPILDVRNALLALGAKVITRETEHTHVSGHGGQKDMKRMYDLLRPQIVVPVHGEEAHLQGQAEFAKKLGYKKVLPIRNGKKASLGPDKVEIMNNTFHCGINVVDGYNILDEDMWIMQDRRKLSYEGVAVVTFAVNQQSREIASDVTITTRGVLDPNLQGDIITQAEKFANQALETVFPDGKVDDYTRVEEVLSQTVRKAINQERGKKPMIIVQPVEV